MPAIKATAWDAKYTAMRAESMAAREHNDCAVVAVTAATGRPYSEVLDVMTRLGRKPRSGTYMHITEGALRHFGFRMVPVPAREFIDRYPSPHHNLRNVTTHQPERFSAVWRDGHTYLIRTAGHILAVINGTNVDWTKGKAKRAKSIYRIERN